MLESEDVTVYSKRVSEAVERLKSTSLCAGHIPDDEEQGFGQPYFKYD
jgi:hypothetical protein